MTEAEHEKARIFCVKSARYILREVQTIRKRTAKVKAIERQARERLAKLEGR